MTGVVFGGGGPTLVVGAAAAAPEGQRLLIVNLAPNLPNYRQRVILSGREYGFELRWSMREERWYLDIRKANGDPLLLALKLVVGWPLLYRFRGVDGIPPGELVVLDPRPEPADPGLAELGDVVQLAYSEAP